MVFSTAEFGVFFVLVFFVTWALGDRTRGRNLFLGAASLYFYACWSPLYLLLILFSVATNYAAAILLSRPGARRRLWLAAGVISNLAILFAYKYLGFATSSLQLLADALDLGVKVPVLSLVLPVGISFYTFQSMSYTVDVYRGDLPACKNPWDFLTYVAFFPQLVAGPIVRARDFIPQLSRPSAVTDAQAGEAIHRILLGLVKKVAISDFLAVNLVDRVFENPAMYSSVEVLVGVYAYALQIYCDFSGYSDIAIGTARLLGFHLEENFALPYRAASLREFWRRWHISLSTWLRDYLYVPLGGSRGLRRWHTYRNLFITMLLGGLWHGPGWTWVAWGGLHGLGLAWERFLEGRRKDRVPAAAPSGWRRALGIVVTFHVVCALWVLFRARSFPRAMEVFGALGELTFQTPNLPWTVLLALAAGYLGHLLPDALPRASVRWFQRLPAAGWAAVAAAVIYTLGLVASSEVVPFIYFQF
ncbi:MAG: MBOAT family protein [Deltaproteobacteria bacterium]|nr:MBOAT family protein [Deltaproteobacteria bacterium]